MLRAETVLYMIHPNLGDIHFRISLPPCKIRRRMKESLEEKKSLSFRSVGDLGIGHIIIPYGVLKDSLILSFSSSSTKGESLSDGNILRLKDYVGKVSIRKSKLDRKKDIGGDFKNECEI